MNVTQQLALWADELRALTGNGLRFVKSQYDETNYNRIREIAAGLYSLVDGRHQVEIESQLLNLLGHYTPMVMGDALVINDDREILLIQRADNGLWAAPGGAFDVGETAAEGAVRECLEETGWRVEPVALIGIYDSRVVGTFTGQHVYHLNFLCRPVSPSMKKPSHDDEVLKLGWFTEPELPPLSPGHRLWVPNAFRFWRGEMAIPYFDRFSPPDSFDS
ncbi:MAG: NUDIX hydrolase N-terminal domain-containing protein [Anaerolineales bacterium]|nr:NUDIX hydrolase N-terminal domain-containing protein [Anaerolineales bacterium]